MAERIQKLTLPAAEFERMKGLAGIAGEVGADQYPMLSAFIRGATHVSDVSVKHVVPDGPNTVVYCESQTFPPEAELKCCWKANAKEWLVNRPEVSR